MEAKSLAKTAKLFASGGSQAVRLPAEFRFSGDAVYVSRDRATGDVILSARPPGDWEAFVALRDDLLSGPGASANGLFLTRPATAHDRDPFAGWPENP